MAEPGFIIRAFLIQSLRCRASLGYRPAPIVERVAMCVRFGPIGDAATVPRTVWQPMHALRANCSAPRCASPVTLSGKLSPVGVGVSGEAYSGSESIGNV